MSPETSRAITAIVEILFGIGFLVPALTVAFRMGGVIETQKQMRDAAILAAQEFKEFAARVTDRLEDHQGRIIHIEAVIQQRRQSDRTAE